MIIYKAEELNKIFDLNDDYIKLLSLLEKINPCNQCYEITEDSLIISYDLKLNLFNFKNLIKKNYPNFQIIEKKKLIFDNETK